ncbi:TIGR04500 family putative peptide maturation system protein [Nonomuraea harbinensis]|uniref:TIGR04500 family putative peptide maturation system protein n=1 Tax=Nonomuraea harbinensis TaxID=1286938 RepID=A0ABW1BW25_9ACTN|nr:TIGR04500 family putative peptide maturation system protein [Nonomuraea harbinensis]
MTTPSTAGFGADLASAVALLRRLPRHRDQVSEARRMVAAWSAAHPSRRPELVVDLPPGDLRAGYDLVLADPEGGSVALTGQAEDGVPWSIEYSTHFAANRLLSVNERSLSVPSALFTIRALNRRDPTLHRQLVDFCLLWDQVFDEDVAMAAEELAEAADLFRRGRGLHSRAATLEWLADVGLTEQAFAIHIEFVARIERFRRGFFDKHAADHLRAHPADFDRVDAVWVRAVDAKALDDLPTARTPADLLTRLGQHSGDLQLTVGRHWALDLPAPLRSLVAGELAGPVPEEGQVILGGVRRREAADATDPAVLARAGEAALAEWLAGQRAKATIRWHWL